MWLMCWSHIPLQHIFYACTFRTFALHFHTFITSEPEGATVLMRKVLHSSFSAVVVVRKLTHLLFYASR